MADRSLRGMRLGSQSLQSEEGVEFASRRKSIYQTEDGKTFDVVFSSDAEIPEVWSSPRTGQEGRLIGDDGDLVKTEEVEIKAPRTHWDMLLERRTPRRARRAAAGASRAAPRPPRSDREGRKPQERLVSLLALRATTARLERRSSTGRDIRPANPSTSSPPKLTNHST